MKENRLLSECTNNEAKAYNCWGHNSKVRVLGEDPDPWKNWRQWKNVKDNVDRYYYWCHKHESLQEFKEAVIDTQSSNSQRDRSD